MFKLRGYFCKIIASFPSLPPPGYLLAAGMGAFATLRLPLGNSLFEGIRKYLFSVGTTLRLQVPPATPRGELYYILLYFQGCRSYIDYSSDVTCACAVGTQLADPVHIYQTQVLIYQPSRGGSGPNNMSAIWPKVFRMVRCGSP